MTKVWCDGCGKCARVLDSKPVPVPKGWFFVKLRFDGEEPRVPSFDGEGVLVCSETCKKKLTWGRAR